MEVAGLDEQDVLPPQQRAEMEIEAERGIEMEDEVAQRSGRRSVPIAPARLSRLGGLRSSRGR